METFVQISKIALKQLQKSPLQVQFKFHVWVKIVNEKGLEKARAIKSYHDEPLKGKLKACVQFD